MRLDHCKKCGAIIDIDNDDGCYVGNPEHLDRPIARYENHLICVCWKCRNEDDENTE